MSLLNATPATRSLGSSGIEISPIAWGMWRLAEGGRSAGEAARLVHAALDAGITLLDTADIYGFDGASGFGDAEALLAAPHPPAIAQDKPLLRGTEQPNSPSKKEEIGARQQELQGVQDTIRASEEQRRRIEAELEGFARDLRELLLHQEKP